MPRVLIATAALLAAISISVDSVAQVTTCSVRRRVVAKVGRISESGDIVDLVEEGFTNSDPGYFAFTAEAAVEGARSSASHSMNWVIGDSAVAATGIHSLEISQSVEDIQRYFYASVMVYGNFTTTSNFEFSYSGVAFGGEAHVLQIERGDGFSVSKRFPISGGEFSYISPALEPGEYEYFFAIVDHYNGSGAFTRAASSEFRVAITPAGYVGVENRMWGMIKAQYR